jgi:hypothetical protein
VLRTVQVCVAQLAAARGTKPCGNQNRNVIPIQFISSGLIEIK